MAGSSLEVTIQTHGLKCPDAANGGQSMIDSIKRVTPSKAFSNARLIDPPETESPNGGYLAKLLLDESIACVDPGKLAPRVVNMQFISSLAFEPMEIDTEILRRSRGSCFVSVKARQKSRIGIVAQLSYGRSESGPYHQPQKMPLALDPEGCAAMQLPEGMWPHLSQHCEYRIAQAPAAFSGAKRADMLTWIRLRDMPLDAGGLLFLFDAMFPVFFLAATRPYQTVTTDFNVAFASSFREQRSGTWVLLGLRVREWAGGWCIEDAEAWSTDGLLLAVARQTRRVFVHDRGSADARNGLGEGRHD
jgi:acyl-CoA thioesterase